jgi:electron transfer flavoprotein alpha subunit
MSQSTYIIAEYSEAGFPSETFELITFARELDPGALPKIIVLGKDILSPAHELAEKAGCDVMAVNGESLARYNSQAYRDAVLDLLKPQKPTWVCLAHTSRGYDLAPGLAVGLNAECITAVEAVHEKTFSRSVFSGRFVEEITPAKAPTVLTIQPGAFGKYAGTGNGGKVTVSEFSYSSNRIRPLGIKEPALRDSSLKDAEVIVSAGRGIGKKENLPLLKELAGLFPRSSIGASRSACDLGWLEYKHQIGTTGRSVSPKLYIACGISGAIQHVSGMKTAQSIVAINIDPHAAIFRIAHFCIVEDVTTFIPVLIEEIKSHIEG